MVVNRKSWWTQIVSQRENFALKRLFAGARYKMAATRSWVQLSTPHKLWAMAYTIGNHNFDFAAIKHRNECVCVCHVLCHSKVITIVICHTFQNIFQSLRDSFHICRIKLRKLSKRPRCSIFMGMRIMISLGNLNCSSVILCLVFCNLYDFHRVFFFRIEIRKRIGFHRIVCHCVWCGAFSTTQSTKKNIWNLARAQ
jgi:hypothetical protein